MGKYSANAPLQIQMRPKTCDDLRPSFQRILSLIHCTSKLDITLPSQADSIPVLQCLFMSPIDTRRLKHLSIDAMWKSEMPQQIVLSGQRYPNLTTLRLALNCCGPQIVNMPTVTRLELRLIDEDDILFYVVRTLQQVPNLRFFNLRSDEGDFHDYLPKWDGTRGLMAYLPKLEKFGMSDVPPIIDLRHARMLLRSLVIPDSCNFDFAITEKPVSIEKLLAKFRNRRHGVFGPTIDAPTKSLEICICVDRMYVEAPGFRRLITLKHLDIWEPIVIDDESGDERVVRRDQDVTWPLVSVLTANRQFALLRKLTIDLNYSDWKSLVGPYQGHESFSYDMQVDDEVVSEEGGDYSEDEDDEDYEDDEYEIHNNETEDPRPAKLAPKSMWLNIGKRWPDLETLTLRDMDITYLTSALEYSDLFQSLEVIRLMGCDGDMDRLREVIQSRMDPEIDQEIDLELDDEVEY
ncbi:hypothetical protein SISSUDRAFT_1041106 [Sistotremastrum suecicum HHB10207 ss-3]|uniref:Uncharacterized protein n=1 Tax=Sistotremastrum suecicum HHB10207 ss-3 TaxID=1314776 RepID=A0A166HLH9_9AGAM|nr:hypothetical protein SISSUDRAFT_1041106 [Sistotremastrum suecicum HHB10207 ss-3]